MPSRVSKFCVGTCRILSVIRLPVRLIFVSPWLATTYLFRRRVATNEMLSRYVYNGLRENGQRFRMVCLVLLFSQKCGRYKPRNLGVPFFMKHPVHTHPNTHTYTRTHVHTNTHTHTYIRTQWPADHVAPPPRRWRFRRPANMCAGSLVMSAGSPL